MEMFTFSAGEAYMIRNGKIAETGTSGSPDRKFIYHFEKYRRHRQRPGYEPGRRLRQGGPIAFARLERQSAYQNSALPDWRQIMEEILDLARKVAEEAEVFWVSSEETPVHFSSQSSESHPE